MICKVIYLLALYHPFRFLNIIGEGSRLKSSPHLCLAHLKGNPYKQLERKEATDLSAFKHKASTTLPGVFRRRQNLSTLRPKMIYQVTRSASSLLMELKDKIKYKINKSTT